MAGAATTTEVLLGERTVVLLGERTVVLLGGTTGGEGDTTGEEEGEVRRC